VALLPAAALLGACARSAASLNRPAASAVALTGGPNNSMVYLARTDSGVVAIDLGWWGGARAVRSALASLGAAPEQVSDVFLTHSHRDHVGAWRLVRGARFHLAADEAAAFADARRHRGRIPRWAERLKQSDLPRAGEVRVRAFGRDTSFGFGADTLRAYLVPGHTAGSAAYLFRGTLFVGDAASSTMWGRFTPARGLYSDSRRRARASLHALWPRLPHGAVRYVCTAHAHCAPFTAQLRARAAGP
jgi:glyoxylase-like metal-dependent hydrolase (beta-lactamase superfamily II)